jgi:hypothetical protein
MQPIASAAALFVSIIIAWTASPGDPLVVEIWPGKVPEESGHIGA